MFQQTKKIFIRYVFFYFSSQTNSLANNSLRSAFRFSSTNELFTAMRPNVGHPSICPQLAQVSSPFLRTQLCTGQRLSQNGVFAPFMRHPVQLIISGVIVIPLSFVHRAAVFSRLIIDRVVCICYRALISRCIYLIRRFDLCIS